jgi:hypothetical protein
MRFKTLTIISFVFHSPSAKIMLSEKKIFCRGLMIVLGVYSAVLLPITDFYPKKPLPESNIFVPSNVNHLRKIKNFRNLAELSLRIYNAIIKFCTAIYFFLFHNKDKVKNFVLGH